MTNRKLKTGACREQESFLPPRIEDYVGPDNPVRAIEAYVASLDVEKLGFRHADAGGGAGQPPYDPADLLKLYLYGYLNQIRSSRRLEREAQRNLELIWLLKKLAPGYRTIAKFRQENWVALKLANRSFVLLARELDLVSGALVAIDGAFFHGDASKASIVTRKRLSEQLTVVDREIEAYGLALEANDAEEAPSPEGDDRGDGGDIAQKMAALMAKRTQAQAAQAARGQRRDTAVAHGRRRQAADEEQPDDCGLQRADRRGRQAQADRRKRGGQRRQRYGPAL